MDSFFIPCSYAASPSVSVDGDQAPHLTGPRLAPPRLPLANTRPAQVHIAQLPLEEQRDTITPGSVGRVTGIAMVEGHLTETIRHLPSSHEVRAYLIATLGVG